MLFIKIKRPIHNQGDKMSVLQAFIQGVVQGLTEFLPVSSSGHLSLVQHFMSIEDGGVFFSVLLHLGTLVAVLIAFFSQIKDIVIEFFAMLGDIFRGKFKLSGCSPVRRMIFMFILSLLPLLLLFPFKDHFNSVAEDSDIIFEGVCFLYMAAYLFIADRVMRRPARVTEVTPGRALFIGAMQGVALLPGVSRSGSTIGAGVLTGVDKQTMVGYSFILGIPVILASAVTEGIDAVNEGLNLDLAPTLVGFFTAMIVGWLAIKLLSWMMKNDKLWIFSVYLCLIGGFSVIGGICGL